MLQEDNFIGYKFKLYPTTEQKKIFTEYFGICRYVYNLCINLQNEQYERYLNGEVSKKSLSFIDLNKIFIDLRNTSNSCLQNVDSKTISFVIKDLCDGYKRYFKGQNSKPHYKKKKNANQSFPVRSERLTIGETSIKLPSINTKVNYGNVGHPEVIGSGITTSKTFPYKHYYNATVSYDGCDYWLSFSLHYDADSGIYPNSFNNYLYNEQWLNTPYSNVLGMDINARPNSWIVLSNGTVYELPEKISRIDRHIDNLKAALFKKNTINNQKKTDNSSAQPEYTNNENKLVRKLNKLYTKKHNIVINAIHKVACDILDLKPRAFVQESLHVKPMLLYDENINSIHRYRHNRMILNAMFSQVQSIISYKLCVNGIPVYYADSSFPSSQLCSSCGSIYNIGKETTFDCPHCANVIDRDLNAAINLSNYLDFDNMNLMIA